MDSWCENLIISIYCRFAVSRIMPVADPGFSLGVGGGGGGAPPKVGVPTYFFAENCMKMNEFGPGGRRIPGAPPFIRQCVMLYFLFDLQRHTLSTEWPYCISGKKFE